MRQRGPSPKSAVAAMFTVSSFRDCRDVQTPFGGLVASAAMLPTRTSKCRLPSSQVGMNVESVVTVMVMAAATGLPLGCHKAARQS